MHPDDDASVVGKHHVSTEFIFHSKMYYDRD